METNDYYNEVLQSDIKYLIYSHTVCQNKTVSCIAITEEIDMNLIHYYINGTAFSFPLDPEEGQDEWNSCVDRLMNDTLPSVQDIILVSTLIQEDTESLFGRTAKLISTLKDIKRSMIENPFILFSRIKPFHLMTKDEVFKLSTMLYYHTEIHIDDDINRALMIYKEPDEGFLKYLHDRNQLKN